MSHPLMRLDTLPTATEFYQHYWNKRPFVVRAAVPQSVMAGLITADELAGLSMDEAVQSRMVRMVRTAGGQRNWSCHPGPFSEEDFAHTGAADWSLLVQNVEQFHPDTAALLRCFSFAPRWLMDDVMVSYSATGGSVGPHIDSYHVFLVQGQGTRRWKIGRQAIVEERYIEGIDLKILAEDFSGDMIEVGSGDVLYLPPGFGHEGITTDSALTFSVGFLGPKMSDLFTSYGQYLSEHENLDQRYVGDGLSSDSAGFAISAGAVGDLRDSFAGHLKANDFTRWLVEFFTEATHQDFGDYNEREESLDTQAFRQELAQGASLIKPEYIKFAVSADLSGALCLGFDNQSMALDDQLVPLIRTLMQEQPVTTANHPELLNQSAALELLLTLYNRQILELMPTGISTPV